MQNLITKIINNFPHYFDIIMTREWQICESLQELPHDDAFLWLIKTEKLCGKLIRKHFAVACV